MPRRTTPESSGGFEWTTPESSRALPAGAGRAQRDGVRAAFLHRLEVDQRLDVVDDRAQLVEPRRRQVALGDQDVDALGQADRELLLRGVELPLREDPRRGGRLDA